MGIPLNAKGTAMKVLRLPATEAKVGLRRSAIYLGVQQGTFPKPIRLTGKATGWIEAELDQWISERPRVRAEVA
jgi:prophage regulatory protein